jgi:Zn-dependent oligopeptidase
LTLFVQEGKKEGDTEAPPGARYEISLSYPHVLPILKVCKVPATRAAVEKAFNSRAHPANTDILEKLAALRCEAAGLLGYPSHAAFVLEERMAKAAETVGSFLATLAKDLKPLAKADLDSLLALKHAEEGQDSGPIKMSDYRYYMEQELRTKFAVDR